MGYNLKTRMAASRKGHRVRARMKAARAEHLATHLGSACELLGKLQLRLLLRRIAITSGHPVSRGGSDKHHRKA